MKLHKFNSYLLLVTLSVSYLLSGCSKATNTTDITIGAGSGETIVVDKNTEVIEEDTEWYSTERINIADAFYSDGRSYSWSFINYLGFVGDTYYCIADYSEVVSDESKKEIIAADSNGNLINRIEMTQYLSDNEYYSDIYVADNSVKAVIQQYPSTFYSVDVDVISGTISSRTELGIGKSTELGEFSKLFVLGNRYIESYSTSIVITDANSNSQTITFKDYFPDDNINWVSNVYNYGDDSILIVAIGDRGWDYYLKLNLTDLSMVDLCPGGTRWLGRISPASINALNGSFYVVDRGVVKEVDFVNHETNDVFDFNHCNINRYDLNNSLLMDFTEDNIVISCKTYKDNQFVDGYGGFYIYNLTKEDTNPNAGKGIIKVGCISDVSRPIADAVYEFNKTNDFFYVHFDTRYDVYDSMNIKYDSSDEDRQKAYIKAQCTLSNQMAIDLLNGEGPDIIIDGFGYGQLNNENYMLDLSSYYETLDSDVYFENIIEGSKVDGALYQIPLSFSIDGIVTSGNYVEPGQKGFTFDSYQTFVDEVCNGKDPINFPRLQYFNLCIDAMSDLFADGKSYNYNNDAFRELAGYVNENVFDNPYYTDVYTGEDLIEPAYYTSLRGFVDYIYNFSDYQYQDMTFLGIPSSDGRGPSVSIINSIGISAQALNPDACWEFVKILLGENVQESLAEGWSFPVSTVSYEKTALAMINRYNSILKGDTNYSYSGMALVGPEIEEQVIKDFAENCIKVSHVSVADPTISVIVSEEIQPFFAGQKSIDQILDILQDRVDTVMAERG